MSMLKASGGNHLGWAKVRIGQVHVGKGGGKNADFWLMGATHPHRSTVQICFEMDPRVTKLIL
jgi:hypothetical protein